MFRIFGQTLTYILVSFLFLPSLASSQDRRYISIKPGEVRVLDVKSVERVAIGNESVLNYKISDEDELIIIGVSPGETSLHVWRKGNRQQSFNIRVTQGDIYRTLITAQRMAKNISGLTVSRQGDNILFEGDVAYDQYALLNNIVDATPGGVLLARQLKELAPRFNTLPMVRIDVHLLDVDKTNLSDIGIRWSDTIAGPAGAIATNIIPSSQFGATSPDPTGAAPAAIASNDSNFFGYLGLTTGIISQINLIEETGAGTILAAPKLVAVSGGEAEFNAGGEFPIQSIIDGEVDIEFKEYGINLVIKPVAYDNKIFTDVYARVSTLDFSVAIGGVPGLLVRDTSTSINMNNGDTLAISGLASIADSNTVSKVPFFGDLPLLGPLFRSTNKRQQGREIIILVTTHLIEPGDKLDKPLQEIGRKEIERFKNFKGMSDALME